MGVWLRAPLGTKKPQSLHGAPVTEDLTALGATILFLMALASYLLSFLAWREGDIWGAIGFVVVPLCVAALAALIVVELRRRT